MRINICKRIDELSILNLPGELLIVIASQLIPEDFLLFIFSCTHFKNLFTSDIKAISNFWQNKSNIHFSVFSALHEKEFGKNKISFTIFNTAYTIHKAHLSPALRRGISYYLENPDDQRLDTFKPALTELDNYLIKIATEKDAPIGYAFRFTKKDKSNAASALKNVLTAGKSPGTLYEHQLALNQGRLKLIYSFFKDDIIDISKSLDLPKPK